jgi:hypothetical protein
MSEVSDASVSRDHKMHQFLLVAFAGIEVTEQPEMSAADQHVRVLQAYERHARLATSKSHKYSFAQLMTVSKGKRWDGTKLMRMFRDIRKLCQNELLPVWNKLVPGGQLPSGKSVDDILQMMLETLWEKQKVNVTITCRLSHVTQQ